MGLFWSPMAIPEVASLALMAPASVSYSTNAIPLRPGTSLTSWKPSKRPKTSDRPSWLASSGRSRRNKILLGGRYSSGTTAAVAPVVGLRPAPFVVLAGRALSAGAAGRLSFFWASRASWACFRSIFQNNIISKPGSRMRPSVKFSKEEKPATHLSRLDASVYEPPVHHFHPHAVP